jgi:hypothetical protein
MSFLYIILLLLSVDATSASYKCSDYGYESLLDVLQERIDFTIIEKDQFKYRIEKQRIVNQDYKLLNELDVCNYNWILKNDKNLYMTYEDIQRMRQSDLVVYQQSFDKLKNSDICSKIKTAISNKVDGYKAQWCVYSHEHPYPVCTLDTNIILNNPDSISSYRDDVYGPIIQFVKLPPCKSNIVLTDLVSEFSNNATFVENKAVRNLIKDAILKYFYKPYFKETVILLCGITEEQYIIQILADIDSKFPPNSDTNALTYYSKDIQKYSLNKLLKQCIDTKSINGLTRIIQFLKDFRTLSNELGL